MDHETVTDAEVVAACRGGDDAAWRELVRRFSRYVFAIARAHRLTENDIEDVFQETFARAYERLGSLREDEAVRPWLAQLTPRLCIDRLRAAAREPAADPSEDRGDLDHRLAVIDEAVSVQEALGRLSPECREILDRFFCRDQSYQTIAAEVGIPPGTIASRISRCLTKLRQEFEGRLAAIRPSGEA